MTGLDSYLYRGCDLGSSSPCGSRQSSATSGTSRSEDLEGFDAVVHLAALSNDPIGDLNAELDVRHQPRRIGRARPRARKEAGVGRFVFASSCSMYGAAPGDDLRRRGGAAPAADRLRRVEGARGGGVCSGSAATDFATVSMRNATVYGASPRLRLDIVLNNLVGWAHTTGAINLQSDGTSWRPLVHVRDIAAASVALLEAPGDDLGRGLQHRHRRAELPRPGSRGRRTRRHAGVRGDVRRGRRNRPA